MMPEFDATVEYRDVVGYPAYKIGNDGAVWSRWKVMGLGAKGGSTRRLSDQWKPMKTSPTSEYGHQKVGLYPGYRQRLVHHLVLEAFVGPRPSGMECCHEDNNPRNNALSNLRWDTSKGNKADMTRHGTRLIGDLNPHAKLTEELVLSMREEYFGGGTSMSKLAAKYGIGIGTASRAVNGKSWSYLKRKGAENEET